ncbi:MAG: NYN domain-containing protein [Anaerolineales bacterium]
MTYNTNKIYAFIDSQNLNLSIQKDLMNDSTGTLINKGWRLDFKRFYIYLQDKYKVDKSFLFIGRVAGNETLYRFLENVGYKVIYKPTLDYSVGKEKFIKGNVDAELVLHSMIEFPNYSKAIIVSGDGDYYCLIEYLINHNKLSHILIPNKNSYSSLLRKYRRYFVYVSDLKGKLEYRK